MAHDILSDWENFGTKMLPVCSSRTSKKIKVKLQGQTQGQRTGSHKWPCRYCPIWKILLSKCSPSKFLAAHQKPFSSRSNFKVIQGRRPGNHKWTIRYCPIFTILKPKCSPTKVLAAHRKPLWTGYILVPKF